MARAPVATTLGGLQIVQEAIAQRRVARRPRHTFQTFQRPWEIQPFLCAPVLPGETMKNLMCQSRVISDPIRNKLTGWWCEYYFFYVKLSDLDGRDDFTAMMLTQGYDLSAYNTASRFHTYHVGPGIDWIKLCQERVVDEYFRDEPETHASHSFSTGIPIASVGDRNWHDSMIDTTTLEEGSTVTGTAEAVSEIFQEWMFRRMNQLTEMDYTDYLKSFGVSLPTEFEHKPELIRHDREWTYPTNTVEPTTGVPTSAAVWSKDIRADKDRFFHEPGFILGLSVVRPKVYYANQFGAGVAMLRDALSWLPAIMREDTMTSMREFSADTFAAPVAGGGPIKGTTNGYWVDVRDLFLYGDQFTNYDTDGTSGRSFVSLPTAALEKRYATSADADALFSEDPVVTQNKIRSDGVVSLNILGTQMDHTPTQNA